MRYRVEQRGAQLVGAAQDLGFGSFCPQPVALDGESDLRRGGRQQAILGAGERASVMGQQQRTDAAVADPHGHQVHVIARAG